MDWVPPCSEDVVPLLQVTQSRRSYKGGADTTPCVSAGDGPVGEVAGSLHRESIAGQHQHPVEEGGRSVPRCQTVDCRSEHVAPAVAFARSRWGATAGADTATRIPSHKFKMGTLLGRRTQGLRATLVVERR